MTTLHIIGYDRCEECGCPIGLVRDGAWIHLCSDDHVPTPGTESEPSTEARQQPPTEEV